MGDLVIVAMYYMLRAGEYTVKRRRNETKQTRQFRLKEVTFFRHNKRGQLKRLRRDTPEEDVMEAVGCTFKIENQKMMTQRNVLDTNALRAVVRACS